MVKAALSDHVDCRPNSESHIWFMRDQDRYAAYIRDAFRRHKELKKQDLAEAMGIPRSQVSELIAGRRTVKAHEIRIIADFFGEPWPDTDSYTGSETVRIATKRIPLYGSVAAGVWLEGNLSRVVGHADRFAPVVPVEVDSDQQSFALRLDDNSLNKLAPAGAFLLCDGQPLDVADLADGDLVVVRQTISALNISEVSARRVRARGEGFELQCESTDPAFASAIRVTRQPANDREIVILGRVTWLVVKP